MQAGQDEANTRLVVVIDDDPMVLDGMNGLLGIWGYAVVAARSDDEALARLEQCDQRPDLIVCDYNLSGGRTGTMAIERVRKALKIPALIVSGDIAAARTREVLTGQYQFLHKPVDTVVLQALLRQMLSG